jgi:hypothetical protein
MQETSAVFSLRELKRLEQDRVEGERADAEARIRAVEDAVARAEAERVIRELQERIARVQADADVATEHHAAERARFEAELARTRVPVLAPAPVVITTPPPRQWPLRVAIAATAAL